MRREVQNNRALEEIEIDNDLLNYSEVGVDASVKSE